MGILRSVALASALMLGLAAAPAHAQPTPDAADGDTARSAEALQRFDEASQVLSEGDPERAAALFREALSLSPRPAIAHNLAYALVQAERWREAREAANEALAGRYGVLDAELRARLSQRRSEAEAHLARVRVHVAGAARAEVDVDGASSGTVREDAPLDVWTEPGARRLSVRPPEGPPIDRELTLEVGARAESRFTFARSESAPARAPDEDPAASPWLWLGVGLGVVAVGLAIGLGVALSSQAEPLPQDLVFGRVAALSF